MKNHTRKNIHIPYNLKLQPYHKVIADLVYKYCNNKPSIIDVGCGLGHTLKEIIEKIPEAILTAADIDKNCLEITGSRVQVQRKIHIHTIEDIYPLCSTFDVVIMSHSLEHMYNPVGTLNNMIKILKPDGILVLAVPNPVTLQVILFNIIKKNYVNKGHVVSWDRSHFMNFLENILSLNVLCYKEDYFRLPFSHKLLFLRPIELLLVKIFPWFSFSNIAVIKK